MQILYDYFLQIYLLLLWSFLMPKSIMVIPYAKTLILKCNYFGMTTVRVFLSKLLASLAGELVSVTYVRCTASCFVWDMGCSRWFCVSPSFEAVFCYIYGLRRVAVARCRMMQSLEVIYESRVFCP